MSSFNRIDPTQYYTIQFFIPGKVEELMKEAKRQENNAMANAYSEIICKRFLFLQTGLPMMTVQLLELISGCADRYFCETSASSIKCNMFVLLKLETLCLLSDRGEDVLNSISKARSLWQQTHQVPSGRVQIN